MTSSANKILQTEFKKLQQQPVEGFTIALIDDSDIFQWKVALYGPPDTLYAGGYFRVRNSKCLFCNFQTLSLCFRQS